MPIHWLLCSAVLLVLPLVLGYFAAPRTNDSFASALFRVPVALAADILVVSVLTIFIPLSIATIAARCAYVVAFVAWRFVGAFRRERQVGAFVTGLVAACPSTGISQTSNDVSRFAMNGAGSPGEEASTTYGSPSSWQQSVRLYSLIFRSLYVIPSSTRTHGAGSTCV